MMRMCIGKENCRRRRPAFFVLALVGAVATTGVLFAVRTNQLSGGFRQLHGAAQAPVYSTYLKVLDILFPPKVLGAKPSDSLIVLRYMPPFRNESQIVVSKAPRGRYIVTYYTLPSGSKSISEQIWGPDSASYQNLSAEKLAAKFKADVRRVPVPDAMVSNLLNRLRKMKISVQPAGENLIDATGYEFIFQIAYNPERTWLYTRDSGYGHDQHAQPLVRWMNEFRVLVEKYANSQDAGTKSP